MSYEMIRTMVNAGDFLRSFLIVGDLQDNLQSAIIS